MITGELKSNIDRIWDTISIKAHNKPNTTDLLIYRLPTFLGSIHNMVFFDHE